MQEKSHCMQVKGFFPECVRTWLLRVPACVHLYSHCLQLNGFTPVCFRMCLLRSPACVQENSHCMQVKGFPPECVRMCLLRWPFVVHLYSHCLQLNDFSPVWTSIRAVSNLQHKWTRRRTRSNHGISVLLSLAWIGKKMTSCKESGVMGWLLSSSAT